MIALSVSAALPASSNALVLKLVPELLMLCYPSQQDTAVWLCADCGTCTCYSTKKGSGSPVSEAKKVLQKGTIALFNEAKRAGADSTISLPFHLVLLSVTCMSAPNPFSRQLTPCMSCLPHCTMRFGNTTKVLGKCLSSTRASHAALHLCWICKVYACSMICHTHIESLCTGVSCMAL